MGQVLTPVIAVVNGNGTVPQGQRHIEFVLSADFAGTIGGAIISGVNLAVYSPGYAPAGYCFSALAYTISAGSAVLTYW